jgi:hypothetical protein
MAKKEDEEKKTRKRKSAYKLGDDAADGSAEAETEAAGDEGAEEQGGAEVIDIEEAREEAAADAGATAEPGEPAAPFQFFETKVGKEVQRAVRGYLIEKVVPPGKESGDMELNVDADFVREHGAALVSTVVESVTNALIPKNLNFTVPVGKAEEGESAEAAPPPKPAPEPGSGVAVNLDFGKLLRGLSTPRPAAPAAEAAPAATTDDGGDTPPEGADA